MKNKYVFILTITIVCSLILSLASEGFKSLKNKNIEVDKNIEKDALIELSKENENVSKFLLNKEIIREIYVPNRIINIVIKE